MNFRPSVAFLLAACLLLPALSCRQGSKSSGTDISPDATENLSASSKASSSPMIPATARAQDVQSATRRLDELAAVAKYVVQGDRLTEIVIQEGSALTADDFALFGKLTDLEKFQVFNCRSLNDQMASSLAGLGRLKSLALTNTVINDPTVELIAKSFPELLELDLSSNTNMTRGAMKPITELAKLQSLTLIQTRFNDLSTRRLKELQELRSLDLRGNMEAGNMTLGVVGQLPNLTAFKHRSTAVTDEGMSSLAASSSLRNLLIQDFMISSSSGEYLAKLKELKQLEIFRCQGFGSEGVKAMKGLQIERLTLRDLPSVDDQAMEVFGDLPNLRRLYLHELDGVTDEGFQKLQSLSSLELLDIWSVPQVTDQAVRTLAKLPNLKELSLRSTGITDAAIETLLEFPKLQTLTIKENGGVSKEAVQKLKSKAWRKLDVGG